MAVIEPRTGVNIVAGSHSLIEFARVSYHVGIREINHEDVRFPFSFNPPQNSVRDFESRHLRLQVVGGNPRRWN